LPSDEKQDANFCDDCYYLRSFMSFARNKFENSHITGILILLVVSLIKKGCEKVTRRKQKLEITAVV
jgi:hypothetical protein